MIKNFFKTIIRETNFLLKNPWETVPVLWLPIAMLFLFGWLFIASSPDHMPVVIVDADRSDISRKLARMIDASAGAAAVANFSSFEEGKEYVRTGKAFALVYIPKDSQADLYRGKQATIFTFFNESYYTAGGLTARAVNSAVSELSKESAPPVGSGPPLAAQATMLFNSQLSYEIGLLPVIFSVLIHLLVLVAVISSVGREIPPQAASVPAAGITASVLGKVFFYATFFSGISLFTFVWLVGIRGYPMRGDFAFLMFSQWLMFVGYGFIGVIFIAISKNVTNQGLSTGAIYAGPAVAFCDAFFPTIGASLFVRFWSNMLPYTCYIEIQQQQFQMGSPVRDSMPGFFTLLVVAVVACPLSIWLLKRTTKKVLEAASQAESIALEAKPEIAT